MNWIAPIATCLLCVAAGHVSGYLWGRRRFWLDKQIEAQSREYVRMCEIFANRRSKEVREQEESYMPQEK